MSKNSNANNKKFIDEFFSLHNEIRQDPKSFIPNLRRELKNFQGNIWERQIGNEIISVETHEGKKVVQEAIDFLQKIKPVEELELKEEISKIANSHAIDMAENNLYDSKGSDGRNPDERIKKFIDHKNMGESIDLGFITVEDIVFSILVDDGVEGRSRRKQFFNPKFKFIGIGISDHPDYEKCCVIDYIGEIIAFKNCNFFFYNFLFKIFSRKR